MPTIADHMKPDLRWTGSPINIGVVEATNYGFEPELIMLIERHAFHGLDTEKAIHHLVSFGELCALVRIDGVPDETIKLILFRFSLMDEAEDWLYSHPPNTFHTWEDLSQAFLNRYVSPSKCLEIKHSELGLTSQPPPPLPTTLPVTDTTDQDFREEMRASMGTLMSQMEQVMMTLNHQNMRLRNLENVVLPMSSNVCGFNPGNFRPEQCQQSIHKPPPDYNYQQSMDSPTLPEYNPYSEQYNYNTSYPPPQ